MSALSPLVLKFLDIYKRDAGLAASAVESACKELAELLEAYPEDEKWFEESDARTRELLKKRILENPNVLEQKIQNTQQGSIVPAECGRDLSGKRVLSSTYVTSDSAEMFAETEALSDENEAAVEAYKAQAEEDRIRRMKKPDPEVELLRHFVATLDKRLDSFQKLEELNLKQIPEYLQRPFNEACHCYLSGHKIASVALCAAIVEGIFRNIFYQELRSNEELTMRKLADLANSKGLLRKDDAEKAKALFEFRNLAIHQLNQFESELQRQKRTMAKMRLGRATEDDVWMGYIVDTRHLIKVLIGTN